MKNFYGLFTGFILFIVVLVPEGKLFAETEQCALRYAPYLAELQRQPFVCNGAVAGTTGEFRSMEGLTLSLGSRFEQNRCRVAARGHVEALGWMEWTSSNGSVTLGVPGESKRLEAVQIYLENCPEVTVRYQAHVEGIGWMDWVQNGEVAGTTGLSLRMEAIRIEVENPRSAIEYRHPVNYFDAETASLHLPLMRIMDSSGEFGNRFVRSRLSMDSATKGRRIGSFTLDPLGPNILPDLTEVPLSSSLATLRIKEDGSSTLTVPGFAVETGDDIQIYDAEFTSVEPNGNRYILSSLVHRPVPMDDSSFVNCHTFFPRNDLDIVAYKEAYRVYGLLMGIAPVDIPNYNTVYCCFMLNYYKSHWPAPPGGYGDGDGCPNYAGPLE